MNLTGPNTLLEFADVTFRYPDGNIGLDGCSLRIARGSRNALIGANGAGKTTLFQHANGLLRPQGGTIRYAGQPIDYSRAGLRRLRSEAGLVFRHHDHIALRADAQAERQVGHVQAGDGRERRGNIQPLSLVLSHQIDEGTRHRAAEARPRGSLDPAGRSRIADVQGPEGGLWLLEDGEGGRLLKLLPAG